MSVTHERGDDDYVGYRIQVRGGPDALRMADWAGVAVYDSDGDRICSFVESVEWGFRPRGWPSEQSDITEQLVWRAYHRAGGAVLLDRLSELNEQRLTVPHQERYAERSEDYLRGLVLRAFKRVYRHNPDMRGEIGFDEVGVALVENVDPKEVEYVLERLKGDGLIEIAGAGHTIGNRLLKPSARGMNLADKLMERTKAPGLLVEETVAEVERALSRHAPDLVERLRGMSMKVAEVRELSHIDVGEMAQSCDLLLQDFLDLPALWQGIQEAKPPKDKTRDRLSSSKRESSPRPSRNFCQRSTTFSSGYADGIAS